MYLELKKKIREYKKSDSFSVEPHNIKRVKSLWDYDISLPSDSHPFHPAYLTDPAYLSNPVSNYSSGDNDIKMPGGVSDNPDPFAKECYGSKGTLTSILDAEHVDSDWMNGVMLAQEIISELTFNQFAASIHTWHSGCTSGLIYGFNHFYKASRYTCYKKIQWEWLGIDTCKKQLENSITGAVGNNDICIGSNLINAANIVKEKWSEGADIIFHDIYPETPRIMLSGIISAIMMGSNRGYLIFRLPDPDKWDANVIDVMLTIAMLFKTVKIWCPMWGRSKRSGVRKIYLVAHTKKKTIYKSNYRTFLALLKVDFTNSRFLKKSVYDDEKVNEWLNVCQNIRLELTESLSESSDSDVDYWMELLTTNLNSITKSKKIE